jgi:hypothetical protein
VICVKAISMYVDDAAYGELKALAKARRRPVAELVRDAMSEHLAQARGRDSIADIKPHASGKLRRKWKRHELVDEMLAR